MAHACVTLRQVPSKQRYPFFVDMHWYVLDSYVSKLLRVSHRLDPAGDGEDDVTLQRDLNDVNVHSSPIKGCSVMLTKLPSRFDSDANCGGGSVDNVFEKLQRYTDTKQRQRCPSLSELTSSGLELQCWLSEHELHGVSELVDFLDTLPDGKRCVPKYIRDSDELLKYGKVLATAVFYSTYLSVYLHCMYVHVMCACTASLCPELYQFDKQ